MPKKKQLNDIDRIVDQRYLESSDVALKGSKEAEEGVIFSLLKKPEKLVDAINKLEPKYFWYDRTRFLYEAMLELFSTSQATSDLTLLKNELEKRGNWGDNDSQVNQAYLMDLFANLDYSPARIKSYTNNVRKKALKRSFEKQILKQSLLVSDTDDISKVMQDSVKEILDLQEEFNNENKSKGFISLSDQSLSFDDAKLNALINSRRERPSPISGAIELDGDDQGNPAMLRFRFADVIVIMSKTSGFKSAFAGQIALQSAMRLDKGKPRNIFYITTELSAATLKARWIGHLARMYSDQIIDYLGGYIELSDYNKKKLSVWDKALSGEKVEFNGKEIYIPGRVDIYQSTSGMDDGMIEFETRHRLALNSEFYGHAGYCCIIVDQIQNMNAPKHMRGTSPHEYVGANMHYLKELANTWDIPVIVISHVNNSLCKQENGMIIPQEYSSADSREIERTAQFTLALAPTVSKDKLYIEILKNGVGATNIPKFVDLIPEFGVIGRLS